MAKRSLRHLEFGPEHVALGASMGKRRTRAADEPEQAAPAEETPAKKRKPLKIDPQVIARARATMRRPKLDDHPAGAGGDVPDPFKPAVPPKGVVAEGAVLAMDEATTGALGWASSNVSWGAQSYMNGAFQEGMTFLGYPYLALLAQRPEYRRIVETIATEMTRKWIRLQVSADVEDDEEDKSERVKDLGDYLEEMNVRQAFRKIAEMDGYFGRAHLYLDTGDTDNPGELALPIGDGRSKLSKSKVNQKKPLIGVRTVEPVWTYPSAYNSNNPLRSDWYAPEQWFVMQNKVHASRCLTFIGREVPDLLKPAYSFGGLSMSQMAKPYVDNWLRTRQSVSDIISSFTVFVLMTNLGESLQQGGDALFTRADLFNLLRDNRGLMMLDKDTEEFKNVSASLSELSNLQAQAQEHMAAVSGIPLVKLLGIQPMGLNASSQGEIQCFYDWIHANQEALFRKHLQRVVGFAMLSLWGEVDPAITFDFEPLWSADEKDEATIRKTDAETDQILIDTGVLHPEEARKRVANDPETRYQGLNVSDVPDLEQEEAEGLEPEGGRPQVQAEPGAKKLNGGLGPRIEDAPDDNRP